MVVKCNDFVPLIGCGDMLYYPLFSALNAFKRVAESLEKLMDATREELPDTMAVFRLSGMEIRDLIMELSDNGSS
ncbi:hypothetical protein SASPL_118132 [Salvia splendens]|uniref:Uncharacterized protein n=1 Tax=Salvia splendens TaxID=180675 RepID=A0A8X8XW62_SALSN|nr:hypothetical protein SASPL_118132 [Salvia splendens]